MSHQPDDRTPEERAGDTENRDASRPLDEQAAWLEIVANYGERPAMGEPLDTEAADPTDPARPTGAPGADAVGPGPSLFDRTYLDAQLARAEQEREDLQTPASWDDEGHFVPPPPPPLPTLDPRRKAAWLGLFGSPLAMLLGIVLGWNYPGWVSFLLVVWFVGGFGYLVATMPRGRGGDWSGDDGAVV